jgi:transcriptional regulator with XRE-family HTH domain
MAKKFEIGEVLHRTVGARIREARRAERREQAWLAAALGVSRTTISNIEGGRQRLFLDQVYEIARQLRIDVATLLPSLEDVTAVAAVRTPSDDLLLASSPERLTRVVSDVLTLVAARSERGTAQEARHVRGAGSGTRRKGGSDADAGEASRSVRKPGASRRPRD